MWQIISQITDEINTRQVFLTSRRNVCVSQDEMDNPDPETRADP